MPRFFTEVEDENNIIIRGDDAHHIYKSLRMKHGENITVTCKGTDYYCTIDELSDTKITMNLVEKKVNSSEPSVQVTLYQALPKGDKFKNIIQKSVELGVTEIVPVLTRRCIYRPTEKDFSKKIERFYKISESAAKQSGRGIIPEIDEMYSLEKAIEHMKQNDINFVLYENGGQRFSVQNLENCRRIGIFIGSEGGFDQEEVDKLTENGAIPIWLGERILRCETAPLAALSILMHITGNM